MFPGNIAAGVTCSDGVEQPMIWNVRHSQREWPETRCVKMVARDVTATIIALPAGTGSSLPSLTLPSLDVHGHVFTSRSSQSARVSERASSVHGAHTRCGSTMLSNLSSILGGNSPRAHIPKTTRAATK